jgi:carbonic anhydrase/acetyltransferase-like protein (isoleucine patch superfamily)
MIIGNGVTVRAGAMVHAATLKDHVVVGSGAQVWDGSVVGSNSIIEAGAIVSPGTIVPDGEVWAGAPAKMVRKITKEDMESITDSADDMAELAASHA